MLRKLLLTRVVKGTKSWKEQERMGGKEEVECVLGVGQLGVVNMYN